MERTGGGNPQDGVPPMEGVSGGGKGYGWNDDGLHGLNILGGSVDPTMFPSGDLLHVWCMPSTANIGKQEAPRSFEPTLPISILAARNERESFQIALRPKVSWGCPGIAGIVKVYCTDLCSASGESLVVGKSVTLRHVVPILGVPDALVPLDLPVSQITLFPGETTAIWVSIDVPAEQPPGEYEGDFFITAMKAEPGNSAQFLTKDEKNQIFRELKNCLGVVESLEHKPMENVGERLKSISTALRRVILSPTFTEISSDNGPAFASLSVHLRLSMTVWDFVLPRTPSLPAVFGISETVIKDRFGVKYGSDEWYEALDQHFKWLLQYRISPFFCRWGDSMRVLAYTCPWPANHPKAEEYYSDPRLAAYAVPYPLVLSGVGNASSNGHTDHGLTSLNATIGLLTCNITDIAKDALKKEIDILRTKTHWKKAYFYLWDKPLKLDNYNSMRNMASEIRTYALDARVLTTYFCGPSDAPLAPTAFEAFVKVPSFLRPHTQIFCTSEWALGNREDLAKDIIAELQPEIGEEWWTYVGMGPSDPQPNWHLGMRGTQHRAVMWRVWKEGGTGFLYWGANCYEKATVPSAEIQFTSRGLPPGDGILFYPGEVFSSSHEPVASVRLERILSGLQDIEYLKLFASVYGRDKGLSLLEKTGVYLGPERYTLEHMPIDVMRGTTVIFCHGSFEQG